MNNLNCCFLLTFVLLTSAQRFNNNQRQTFNTDSNNYNSRYNTNSAERLQQKSTVGCPEKNGRFPTKSCDGYIECVEGIGEEKLCPDGLLFNAASSIFSYPCQYPIDVNCTGRNNIQPAQATEDCPHQFGYFRIGGPAECGQFKNCVDGHGFTFDCPEGLAFNEETYRCDWPDQVASCDAPAYLGFSCPDVPEAKLLGLEEGYRSYRSSKDCQRYFICIQGRPRLYNCGEGMAFNEITNTCDGIENVTGCASSGSSYKSNINNINNNNNNLKLGTQRFRNTY